MEANVFRRLLLIGVWVTFWPAIALAANDAPSQTGAFLAYCKTNSEGCLDKIAKVSFVMLVGNLEAKKQWCPTKETDDVKILTPKVVQWLTGHPDTNSKTTDAGIKTALIQLYPYPCKPGTAVPKAAETTGDFLTFCQAKANHTTCMTDIVDVSLAFIINEKMAAANNYCEPKNFEARDNAPAVLNWLTTHTELRAAPKTNAIAKAWGALYPCRKK
jgi:hypothetical protein